MGTFGLQMRKQVPGLRIPPTRGCRSCDRPEVSPALTCNDIIGMHNCLSSKTCKDWDYE